MAAMSRRIRKLPPEENVRARLLYEEIFTEDSREFVDYYFQIKAAANEIFVVEDMGEILSMLHLNPYPMCFCGHTVNTAYIVAVATQEKYRHQGMMASLMKTSLQDLYRKESPFTWLMPAAEAIYYPFGFRYIYRKNQMYLDWDVCRGILRGGECQSEVCCRIAEEKEIQELVCLSQQILPDIAGVYTCHSFHYFEDLKQGVESDGGCLAVFTADNRICGYFLASPGEREAWEIVVLEKYRRKAAESMYRWFGQYGEGQVGISAFPLEWEVSESCRKVPAIMGRIVHLEKFVQYLRTEEKREWFVSVADELILQNNGMFRITTGPGGSSLERLPEWKPGMRQVEIGSLLEEMFPASVFLNELV